MGALAVCAVSVAGLTALRLLVTALALRGLPALLVQAVGQLLFALCPAVFGLLALEGGRAGAVRFQALGPRQIGPFALTGVLAVFPAALLSGVMSGLARAAWTAAGAAAAASVASPAPDMTLFLPMLLCEGLLAPVCEELLYRGYLLGAWERGGRGVAIALTSAAFALAHGLGVATPSYALLGAALAMLTLRADSALAAMLMHGCYNAALVALTYLGLGGLIGGTGLFSCAVQLAGSAAFAAALKRALSLRPGRRRARLWDGGELSRRERMLLAGAALAFAVSLIVGVLL